MQGPIRCVVVAGLLLGCGGDDTTVPTDDAPVAATGLVVEWASQPSSWPGDFGDGVVLERATFAVDSLRVIGDAGPGDPRTTANGIMVRWDSGVRPSPIEFAEAPTGLYSQLSVVIDGQLTASSFELRGRAFVEGTDYEFRIEDSDALAVTVAMAETFSPPAPASIVLRINFEHALDAIDFTMLEIDSGRLELETGDPQMAVFRTKLVESFEITDAGSR